PCWRPIWAGGTEGGPAALQAVSATHARATAARAALRERMSAPRVNWLSLVPAPVAHRAERAAPDRIGRVRLAFCYPSAVPVRIQPPPTASGCFGPGRHDLEPFVSPA